MSTDKYPNRNVNYPYTKAQVDAATARLIPQGNDSSPPSPAPFNGKGSRRQVRPGEWIDDRTYQIGGPATPSKESPPELPPRRERALPTFEDDKVYTVTLSKGAMFSGRMLAPGKAYQMAGYAATEVIDSIESAELLGDIPDDPDAPPSEG
jgi:hypothetical protein